MIEVFKTNVIIEAEAQMLLGQIYNYDHQYKANFDLDDCDHILRVESMTGHVESSYLIQLLGSFGFYAEILPDEDSFTEETTNPLKSASGLNTFKYAEASFP